MSVYTNLKDASVKDAPISVANPCVPGATVRFTSVLSKDVSKFSSRKANAILFLNARTPEKATIRFSLTRNNARFNLYKEAATFDGDLNDFVVMPPMTSEEALDWLIKRFGNFLEPKDAFQVTFGTNGHFLNSDGEIVHTVTSIEKIENCD